MLDLHWDILGIGGAAFLLTWNDTGQSPRAASDSDPSLMSAPSYPPGFSAGWGLTPYTVVSSPQQVPITKGHITVHSCSWTRASPFQRSLRRAGRTCHQLHCPREVWGNTTITAFLLLPEEHLRRGARADAPGPSASLQPGFWQEKEQDLGGGGCSAEDMSDHGAGRASQGKHGAEPSVLRCLCPAQQEGKGELVQVVHGPDAL